MKTMIIDKYTANKIVKELNYILQTDINFFDHNGIVISSTQVNRIGTYHKIAHEALISGKLIIQNDNSIDNVLEGINFPIDFNYKTIGVIGITGKPCDYLTISRVCKSMTEILLKEIYFNNMENYYINGMKKIIEHVIFEYSNNRDIQLNEFFNNDIANLYFTAIQSTEDIIEEIFVTLSKKDRFCLSTIGDTLIVLTDETDFHINLLEKYQYNIKIGIGDKKITTDLLATSYKEALISLNYCEKTNHNYIEYINLKTEHILNSISLDDKISIVSKFFYIENEIEFNELIDLFITYFEYNRSLVATSKKFFIHKNTVKYRLEKISNITNLNYLDNVDSSFLYYLSLIYKEINE